jgi:hypothetical protein
VERGHVDVPAAHAAAGPLSRAAPASAPAGALAAPWGVTSCRLRRVGAQGRHPAARAASAASCPTAPRSASTPSARSAPRAAPIAPHLRPSRGARRHLGLPLMREGVANYALSSDASAPSASAASCAASSTSPSPATSASCRSASPPWCSCSRASRSKDHAALKIGEVVRDLRPAASPSRQATSRPALAVSAAPNLVRRAAGHPQPRHDASAASSPRSGAPAAAPRSTSRSASSRRSCSSTPSTAASPGSSTAATPRRRTRSRSTSRSPNSPAPS